MNFTFNIVYFLFDSEKISKFEYRQKLCELYEGQHNNIPVKFPPLNIKTAQLKF